MQTKALIKLFEAHSIVELEEQINNFTQSKEVHNVISTKCLGIFQDKVIGQVAYFPRITESNAYNNLDNISLVEFNNNQEIPETNFIPTY